MIPNHPTRGATVRTLTALTATLATLTLATSSALAATATASADFDTSHAYSFTELADDTATLASWDNPAPHDWHTTSPTGGTGRTGWFGEAWSLDEDGNGCDARQDTLARDMVDVVDFTGSSCKVAAGTLKPDVYTDTEVRFVHSNATATTIDGVLTQPDSQVVQIDHTIPLSYTWAHGAWAWTQGQRETFANDPLVLVAADGDANNAKDDSLVATSPTGQTDEDTYQVAGGGGWEPAPAYRCAYDARITLIALKYHLGVTDADATTLHDELTDCATAAPDATFTPTTVQTEAVSKTLAGTTTTPTVDTTTTSSSTTRTEHTTTHLALSPRALAALVAVVLVAALRTGRRGGRRRR